MKYYLIIMFSLLNGFTLLSYSQSIEKYNVNKTNSLITIDGILDEEAWANTDSTKSFVILGDNQAIPKTNAWAKLLWDETYLYVSFFCEDKTLVATYLNRDDFLYKEDAVEVYIDPDGDGENYLEIEVSPINTIFDLWLTKPLSDGGQRYDDWTMSGLVTQSTYSGTLNSNSDEDNSWTCEMAMPFEAMRFCASSMNFPPLAEDVWRLNMYRFDRAFNNDPDREATGWSQTDGGQHEPDKFGEITFKDIDVSSILTAQNMKSDKFCFLEQNYPNPFQLLTTIGFFIPSSENVEIIVFNSQGAVIEQLVNCEMAAGFHTVNWNAENNSGGIYYYRIITTGFSDTRKMILMK